jgi:dienelactone hydrolase
LEESPVLRLRPTVIAVALIFFAAGAVSETTVDRVPLPPTQDGRILSLEVVIFKPAGEGPFPAVIFNHGSGGRGNDPARLKQTWVNEHLANSFNARGWLVAFPQRRGRGRSDGINDEGYEPDRSAYSCTEKYSSPGIDRAVEDIDAVLDYVTARIDVDRNRVIIGGQSRGGILAIAFAGKHPGRVTAVINFAGGWVGDTCPEAVSINTKAAKLGAAFDGPTLWLYGENDSMYKTAHSRANFAAFRAMGGQGELRVYSLATGIDGHRLIDHPEIWAADVDQFSKNAQQVRVGRRSRR